MGSQRPRVRMVSECAARKIKKSHYLAKNIKNKKIFHKLLQYFIFCDIMQIEIKRGGEKLEQNSITERTRLHI